MGDDETLRLQLTIEAEGDEEELDDLTTALRRELLELDVGDVAPRSARARRAPAASAWSSGSWSSRRGRSCSGPVLATIQSWLANRRKARAVRVKLPNGTEFELDGANTAQVDELLELVKSQASQ